MQSKPTVARVATLLVPLILSGCSEPLGPPESVTQPFWTPLFLVGTRFVDIEFEDGSMFVAERTQGVYIQQPAFSGGWRSLGLQLEDVDEYLQLYGITSLAADGDLLVAGLNLPFNDPRPRLYQRHLGDTGWTPSATIEQSAVQDLITLSPGHVLGLEKGITFSSNQGAISTLSEDQLSGLELGRLFIGPDGTYCGGHGPLREPKLFKSVDGGTNWKQVGLGKSLGLPVGTIYEMTGFGGASPSLLITVDADVYRSDDGGKSFNHLLEIPRTPGQIHVNPSDTNEILITGGPLFWTHDGGINWDVFFLPRGLPIRMSKVEWDSRKMAVIVTDGIREAVYAFDLQVAGTFLTR